MHCSLKITKQSIHKLSLHVRWFQKVCDRKILRQPFLQKMPQTHLGTCLALLHCRMLRHETVRQRRLRFLLFLRLKSHLSKFNHSFIYATIKSSFHYLFSLNLHNYSQNLQWQSFLMTRSIFLVSSLCCSCLTCLS